MPRFRDLQIPNFMPYSKLRCCKDVTKHLCSPSKPNNAAGSVVPTADFVQNKSVSNLHFYVEIKGHTLASFDGLGVFQLSLKARAVLFAGDHVDE